MRSDRCGQCHRYEHRNSGGPRTSGTCTHPDRPDVTYAVRRACDDFARGQAQRKRGDVVNNGVRSSAGPRFSR